MPRMIGLLIGFVVKRVAAPAAAGGIAVTMSDITLGQLRQEAFRLSPGSDPAALEEAARHVYRMLGNEGDEILWPTDRLGRPIAAKYYHMNMTTGQSWFTSEYISKKYVRAARRRPMRRRSGGGRITNNRNG